MGTTSNVVASSTPTVSSASGSSGQAIDQYEASQVNNPTLTSAETLTPTLQDPNAAGTQLTGQASDFVQNTPQATAAQATAPGSIPVTNATATTVDPNSIPQVNPNSGTYTAATTGAAQGTAVTGQVNPLDTVQGQLASLYSQFGNGNVPAWAQGAINAANAASNSRGLGTSTIGTTAITAAIQQGAINIAAPDAATYFQMDMSNLTDEQNTALANTQNRQQSLLSNQAAQNAALQFNASSTAQVNEFNANLVSTILQSNAAATTAISQFNAASANTAAINTAQLQNSTSQFNAAQMNAISTLNAQLSLQTQQFNATNQFAIDQSNVTWQRSIATANTAAINAANQVNVQNSFNMSQTALNNLWQEFRDNASYTFTASQNAEIINANAAMVSNNQQFVDGLVGNSTAAAVGSLAGSILGILSGGTTSQSPSTPAIQ